MKKLPDKLSDLIDVALADLEKVEKDKRYAVDMSKWHVNLDNSKTTKCHVCFAGSVMAKSFDLSAERSYNPEDFLSDSEIKFHALNEIRQGYVWYALIRMRQAKDADYEKLKRLGLRFVERCKRDGINYADDIYRQDKNRFKEYMRRFAYSLRELGY